MSIEPASVSPEFLASVQPIVLVGGKSRRFGRDKLREPWAAPGRMLVQQPIDTLRAVFGPRVKLVGECDPGLLPLADGLIPDLYPGAGPIGGILSALIDHRGPVFVLAGDMPSFSPRDAMHILGTAQRHPESPAVLAFALRLHPCAGVYAPTARSILEIEMSRGHRSLSAVLAERPTLTVSVPESSVTNINFPPLESIRGVDISSEC